MEFGLVGMFDGCCCAWSCTVCDIAIGVMFYSLPVFWMCRFVYRLCKPLSDGNLTHIEFPLPQIVPSAPYEPPPVEMLVGSCSEASGALIVMKNLIASLRAAFASHAKVQHTKSALS